MDIVLVTVKTAGGGGQRSAEQGHLARRLVFAAGVAGQGFGSAATALRADTKGLLAERPAARAPSSGTRTAGSRFLSFRPVDRRRDDI